MKLASPIRDHLTFLYGPERGNQIWPQLRSLLIKFQARNPHLLENVPSPAQRLTERDVILITYGDQIRDPGQPPLQTLARFLEDELVDFVTGVHLLPFYPYSSDDGFSVIDYRRVNPELGSWDDVAQLGRRFRLMFDAVINHVSRQSRWFLAYVQDEAPYNEYFIEVAPETDLSSIVRPRALPLLTPVETVGGRKYVWTTFSADQIDLNYSNPSTLLDIIDLLLFYVERGAKMIRLDAIAYLWKEPGTPSIHLPQTHHMIKLFRAVLNAVAPRVLLITETNVPHAENVRYFGDGYDEAQLVYQFSLAPLVLNAIQTGNARHLQAWAVDLSPPSPQTTFLNFLASHDGIGLMPARGILTEDEIEALVGQVKTHGGYVSYKTNPDGSQSVYELNISYFDALSDPQAGEPVSLQVQRFMAAQAIMLGLRGVPAIYVHSLLGSRSYHRGVRETGRQRTVNRQKFDKRQLARELADPGSLRSMVFAAYSHLLRQRLAHPAFHPAGLQKVLTSPESIFAWRRTSPDGTQTILCVHNLCASPQSYVIDLADLSGSREFAAHDLVAGLDFQANDAGQLRLALEPYQVLWLKC
jgi:glucosylglycerate phosphorylase